MHWFQIFCLVIVIPLTCYSISIDPICHECLNIDSSLMSVQYIQSKEATLSLFTLPGFSQSTIILDLRHLDSIPYDPDTNQPFFKLYFLVIDTATMDQKINQISDIIVGTNEYQLSPTKRIQLLIYFKIKPRYLAYQYLLRSSVSLSLKYSNNRIPYQDSSYVFVVKSIDNINLPKNKPEIENFPGFFLQNVKNHTTFVSQTEYAESTTYWSTETQFAVPYFPYFSDCNEQGNMLQITQVLQSAMDCDLVPLDKTVWINQFKFGSFATADRCLIKRTCMIEGQVKKTEYPEWQTLPSLLNLFSISQKKVRADQYDIDMTISQDQLVKCKIQSSEGSNSSTQFPLNVKIQMGYYQETLTEKRIIRCRISYSLYVESHDDFEYQLEIYSYPLTHTYIMLSFGFEWYVYMIVFVIIGIVSNIEHLILWAYHYWVSETVHPFRIRVYLHVISEVLRGTFGAMILLLATIVIVCVVMNGKLFSWQLYQTKNEHSSSPRVLWDYVMEEPTKDYDSTEVAQIRAGRMGLSFAVIGLLVILGNCRFFIGKDKCQGDYNDYHILGRVFRPIQWNTGKFLFGTFFYVALQFFFIYFAYSTLYSKNIWAFIVTMKIIQMIMEEIAKSVYEDLLPCLPLKILTDITSYLNTLSANDFYDFLFSFLVDVAMTMIEKAYVSQLQNMVVDKIQEKSEELNKFYLTLMNEAEDELEEMQTEEDRNSEDNQRVFIYRQAQEVEFIQQDVKEIYTQGWEADATLIELCQQTEQEKLIRRRYFDSLKGEYNHQQKLLFKIKGVGAVTGADEDRKGVGVGDNRDKDMDRDREKGCNPSLRQASSSASSQESRQLESLVFELLIDNIALLFTFFVQPFVVLILWVTYEESAILSSYGISSNTVVLYNLSAVVIGIFAVVNVVLIFHILESYLDISFQEQIKRLLQRFYNRQLFWKADDQDLNHALNPMLQGADHYCLSSQFFFILTVYLSGMLLLLLGLAIMFNNNYNLFDDIATALIALFWGFIYFIILTIANRLLISLNFWEYQKFQQTSMGKGHLHPNRNSPSVMAIKDITAVIKQKELRDRNLNIYFDGDDNSDFQTDNILYADEQSSNAMFTVTLNGKEMQNKGNADGDESSSSFDLSSDPSSKKNILRENQTNSKYTGIDNELLNKNKKMRTMTTEHQKIHNFETKKNEIVLAQRRLETICKKLEPLFENESFRKKYALQNRQYIGENIEKILPLVDHLPELQDYKLQGGSVQSSSSMLKGKKYDDQIYKKGSDSNKNMNPLIAEMVLQWFRYTERDRNKRILSGLESQGKNKKCSFCFQSWGLCYGYGGVCMDCNMRLDKLRTKQQSKRLKEQSTKDRYGRYAQDKLNIINEEQEGSREEELQSEDQKKRLNRSVKGKKHHQD